MLLRLSGIPCHEIKCVNFSQPAVGGDGKHKHVRHVANQLAVSLTSFRSVSVPQGWLEPLLHGILHNPFVTVYPITETIHDASLWTQETKRVDNRGIFRWKDLNFLWEYLPAYERDRRKSLADPIRYLSGGRSGQASTGYFDMHKTQTVGPLVNWSFCQALYESLVVSKSVHSD